MNLILSGLKGSGKSTLAKAVASRLKRPYIDTDLLIAPNCRLFYREIGEKAFRAAEKRAVFSLSGVKDSIIALGGGVLLDPENVFFLKKIGKLVYLKTSQEELRKRIWAKPWPAFFDPLDPEGSFEKMVQERSFLYEKAADFTVRSEKELWEVMRLESCFASLLGENRTEKPSASSSTAALPASSFLKKSCKEISTRGLPEEIL